MTKRGKPFEKGNNLGEGRPPLPAWAKQTKALTAAEFSSALNDICRLSKEHIRTLANDEGLPIKTHIMANWLLSASHDNQSRTALFDRLYGKPKESVEVNLTMVTERMSDDDLYQACRDAIKIIEEEKALLGGTGPKE